MTIINKKLKIYRWNTPFCKINKTFLHFLYNNAWINLLFMKSKRHNQKFQNREKYRAIPRIWEFLIKTATGKHLQYIINTGGDCYSFENLNNTCTQHKNTPGINFPSLSSILFTETKNWAWIHENSRTQLKWIPGHLNNYFNLSIFQYIHNSNEIKKGVFAVHVVQLILKFDNKMLMVS